MMRAVGVACLALLAVAWWLWPVETDRTDVPTVLPPSSASKVAAGDVSAPLTTERDEPEVLAIARPHGRVVDARGRPIAGATVTSLATLKARGFTNDRGVFVLPEGEDVLLVRGDGFRQEIVRPTEVQRVGTQPLVIAMTSGSDILLRVVDHDGDPIEHALVMWRTDDRTDVMRLGGGIAPGRRFELAQRIEGRHRPMTLTDREGFARLSGITDARGACLIGTETASQRVADVRLEGREVVDLGTVRMPVPKVTWTVVDRAGRPLAGVAVTLHCGTKRAGSVTTDALGNLPFDMASVPCSHLGIKLAHDSYTTRWVPDLLVAANATIELERRRKVALYLVDAETQAPIDLRGRTSFRYRLDDPQLPPHAPRSLPFEDAGDVGGGRARVTLDEIFTRLEIAVANYHAEIDLRDIPPGVDEIRVAMGAQPPVRLRITDASTGVPLTAAYIITKASSVPFPDRAENARWDKIDTEAFLENATDPSTGLFETTRASGFADDSLGVVIAADGYRLMSIPAPPAGELVDVALEPEEPWEHPRR